MIQGRYRTAKDRVRNGSGLEYRIPCGEDAGGPLPPGSEAANILA